jgi:hypothetical protein
MLLEDGSVEIWLPPKQMTICGKAVGRKEKKDEKELHPYQGMIFRLVALPAEDQVNEDAIRAQAA